VCARLGNAVRVVAMPGRGSVPVAGARIQRRKKRMVAFSKPRNPHLETRHLFVANTGPALGVSVQTLWDTFQAYGLVERIVVEHPKRAYVIVSFVTVASATAALRDRNRPAGAGSIVKVGCLLLSSAACGTPMVTHTFRLSAGHIHAHPRLCCAAAWALASRQLCRTTQTT